MSKERLFIISYTNLYSDSLGSSFIVLFSLDLRSRNRSHSLITLGESLNVTPISLRPAKNSDEFVFSGLFSAESIKQFLNATTRRRHSSFLCLFVLIFCIICVITTARTAPALPDSIVFIRNKVDSVLVPMWMHPSVKLDVQGTTLRVFGAILHHDRHIIDAVARVLTEEGLI